MGGRFALAQMFHSFLYRLCAWAGVMYLPVLVLRLGCMVGITHCHGINASIITTIIHVLLHALHHRRQALLLSALFHASQHAACLVAMAPACECCTVECALSNLANSVHLRSVVCGLRQTVCGFLDVFLDGSCICPYGDKLNACHALKLLHMLCSC